METQATISSPIQELFRSYEKFSQQKDFKSQAQLFSNDLIAATPVTVQHHANNAFSRWMYDRGMQKFYSKAGLTSVKMQGLEETPISLDYTLVKVHWVANFEKTGNMPVEYDITYIVRDTGKRHEIVMFIAHEDEMKALRGYGIIE